MKSLFYFAVLLMLFYSCGNHNKENSKGQETPSKTPVVTRHQAIDSVYYLSRGKKIARETFNTLSGKLKQALQAGGIENAISYCNAHALSLTDSLASVYQASVQRISHKPRNINNKANTEELKIMGNYIMKHIQQPTLVANDTSVTFYAPIYTKPFCLTCHGEVGKTLTADNYEKIKELYPEDKAVGFKVNELRGMWKISFRKEEK